jgi:chemotaxis protein MotA
VPIGSLQTRKLEAMRELSASGIPRGQRGFPRGGNMFAIIGIIAVFGAVIGGFLMEKGHLLVLMQPSELVIIGGAALGTLLIGNPLHVIRNIGISIVRVVTGKSISRQHYIDSLRMMFILFTRARKEGMTAIELDIEEPEKSQTFSRYPSFLNNHHVRDFVCDTMRMAITGGATAFDVDQMMELDMEVHHRGASEPASALTAVADSLPGFGIVAAVLGVVITMGALGGPPEQIGHKVAAALVGTFLGILLCYGMVAPIAAHLTKLVGDDRAYYHVLRVLMLSFIKGMPPTVAVEMGRRAVPEHVRPGFQELEKACRQKDDAPGAVAV